MIYGSVCSGIEAATVAWHPLGWRPSFFSEIEAFPRALLSHHYPRVPLHGDFTSIKGDEYEPIDLLVGGTPCQSFSVAGLRGGLDDDRGNLALEFLKLARRTRPRWLVWENVPGCLSSNGGRDFGSILRGMAECGYGFAYRVLDAQYFGLAQRRRRVFVVGHFGDWRPAAAVLFERESLRGNPAPSRQARPAVAALTATGVGTCGADDNQAQAGHLIAGAGQISHCLNAGGMGRQDYETETLIAHTLRGEGFDASEDGTGRGVPLVPTAYRTAGDGCIFEEGNLTAPLTTGTDPSANIIAFSAKDYGADAGEIAPTLRAGAHRNSHANSGNWPAVAMAFQQNTRDEVRFIGGDGGIAGALAAEAGMKQQNYVAQPVAIRGRDGGAQIEIGEGAAHTVRASQGGSDKPHVFTGMSVRRLTPRECERLQGFPDDYTLIPYRGKPAADGPRYKALGNSMAVPVVHWIGKRIQKVDEILARVQPSKYKAAI